SAATSERFKLDEDVRPDVLIVGSGAAALTAALRARFHQLKPLIVEKSANIGGTSAYSGGGLWIPKSHVSTLGDGDSIEEALGYMEALIGDAGPASTRERKVAYLRNGPKMAKFLDGLGFRWTECTGYPDYYPDLPGGKVGGRSIEPQMFDLKKLGRWR